MAPVDVDTTYQVMAQTAAAASKGMWVATLMANARTHTATTEHVYQLARAAARAGLDAIGREGTK